MLRSDFSPLPRGGKCPRRKQDAVISGGVGCGGSLCRRPEIGSVSPERTALVLEGGKVAQAEMLLSVSPLWQPY